MSVVTRPAASAAGQKRLVAPANPTPASAATRLGLRPHTSTLHVGADEIRQRARPGRGHPQLVTHRLDRHRGRTRRRRRRRPARPVASWRRSARRCRRPGIRPSSSPFDDAEHDRCTDGERAVEVRERERQVGPADVQVGVARPRRPQAGRPERQRGDVAVHAPRSRRGWRGRGRAWRARRRGPRRRGRREQVGQVAAGTAPHVEQRTIRWRRLGELGGAGAVLRWTRARRTSPPAARRC